MISDNNDNIPLAGISPTSEQTRFRSTFFGIIRCYSSRLAEKNLELQHQTIRCMSDSLRHVDHGKNSTTMTFRLDENLVTTLRLESERRHISMNSMINQILRRYVEWDMYESKLGLISMLKPVVAQLFKKTSKQEIIELATSIGKNATNDAALFMKNKMDLDSFLSWLDVRMKNSSVEINHNIEGSTHTYILKHDLGENYSLFQKTVLELIFNDVLRKRINCSMSNTILSFSFST
jgi:predicted HicB family RNase H-like nuclease